MALLHTAGRTAASAARQSFFDRPRASLTALGWLMTYHLVSRKAQTSSARPILQFCLYLSLTRGAPYDDRAPLRGRCRLGLRCKECY